MPRTPLQYKEIKDERKLSILEASLPLFAVKGKNNVSVDEISKAAGCSHGLVYHYFPNTDYLYKELISSDTFENYNKLIFDESLQLEDIVKNLLSISLKELTKIYYFVLLVKDENQELYSQLLLYGVEKTDLDTFFALLKGVYVPLITEKHPVCKVPNLQSVLKLFK